MKPPRPERVDLCSEFRKGSYSRLALGIESLDALSCFFLKLFRGFCLLFPKSLDVGFHCCKSDLNRCIGWNATPYR